MHLNVDAHRPKPFYFLTTTDEAALGVEAVGEALTELKAAGFGGAVLFNKPPTGFSREEYLGERWFRAIRRFAEAAVPLGLEIWVNDGFDFPPGSAAGRIQRIAPHLTQQRLVLEADGTVAVRDAPWGFPAFEEPESSRLFIELVYEAYRREVGDLFGRGIVGFFSDADNRRMPHGVLDGTYYPWSSNFAATFEQACGHSIEPHLTRILGGTPGQATVDYWRHAGRLYQQWFANNHAWCRAHGLKYSFHTSDSGPFTPAEMPRSSIFNEGDAFELHAHADLPGTDHELRTLNGGTPFLPGTRWRIERARWGQPGTCRSPDFSTVQGDVRAKLASSAAFLFGRAGALCECFAATNWSAETDDLRRIGTWQIMQGITVLVPHAAHHRFFGPTKYFAPPEFLRCGALRESLRQLNDDLAELCAIASWGQLIAPVALLDPTEEVWRTGQPCPRFFALSAELNRRPQGYVIAPPAAVPEHAARLRVAINPGITVSQTIRDGLAAAGIALLRADQLDRLDAFLPVGTGYRGTGRPHFMRRAVEGGELLLLANVEDEGEIRGEALHAGETYAVSLLFGEVAVFGPNFRRRRRVRKALRSVASPPTAEVAWGAPNVVTLLRWEDETGRALDGDAVAKAGALFFRWRNDGDLPALRLLAPAASVRKVCVDGRPAEPGTPMSVYDEQYLALDLAGAGGRGDHALRLACEGYAWTSPCFLEGEFDCEIAARGGDLRGIAYYNFALTLPESVTVLLRNRRGRLDMSRSWAEQGHPFYSGVATYRFDFDIPPSLRRPVLRCGRVHCHAALTVNGVRVGARAFPPYEFDLQGFSGACEARLTVESTLGNRLDGYGAPAGLAAVPEVMDLEEEGGGRRLLGP